MATFKINGQLNIVFEDIEIDAANEEEALNKLYKMGCKDIIEDCYIKESDIVEEEVEITEADYKIRVRGIDYSIEYYDIADQVAEKHPELEEGSTEFDELVDKEITELKKSLPQSLDLEICCCAPDDLEDVISDMISEETGWLINSFDSYKILEVK